MGKRLTIRAKILWIAFVINALCTGIYTAHSYLHQRKTFLEGIDRQLLSVAHVLPLLLPENFHDRIKNRDSISQEEHRELLMLLSDYTARAGIEYLYSYMKFNDEFVVASTSATRGELAKGEETAFFTKYKEPPLEMLEAWNSDRGLYAEYEDEWGRFRSFFLPMITDKGARFIVGADVSVGFIREKLQRTLMLNIGLGALIFAGVWILSYSVITHILAPVGKLTGFTKRLTDTDFQLSSDEQKQLLKISEQNKDEVGQLAQAFSEMQVKLLDYIEDLKTTTAAKERFESELNIAHEIQMSFLKKIFPPFPDREEFDLYAMLYPAKEVGGDLYDFCMIDDENLCFYVGDVSDKGVPSALFMAVTMTLMKRSVQQGDLDPAAILKQVNIDLAEDNEKMLFVTLVCGILNVRTGELRYSNAGHNPPVLLRSGDSPVWLDLPKGLVLGAMVDAEFKNKSIQLDSGDRVLLYTDGVTEAMNCGGELYSNERLIKESGAAPAETVGEFGERVMKSVKTFAGEAPQSDDITILVLEYH